MNWSALALVFAPVFAVPPAPATPAVFGPPFVCHALDIGSARSLPWEKGKEPSALYDRGRLVADVAELLKTETDLLVRMETLRRAAIYAGEDRALAVELVGRRALAIVEQSAIGSKESLAWFDAGVLVVCLSQLGVDIDFRAGVAEGFDGYGYLLKALETARKEKSDQMATIEFAAALAAHPAMRKGGGDQADLDRYWRHVDAARAGVQAGSLVAKNLAEHVARWEKYVARKQS